MAIARRAGGESSRENPRRKGVLETARTAGLFSGTRDYVAGWIHRHLIVVANARSGITSDTRLLEYALARVALDDDFGRKLLAREGRLPRNLDLEL